MTLKLRDILALTSGFEKANKTRGADAEGYKAEVSEPDRIWIEYDLALGDKSYLHAARNYLNKLEKRYFRVSEAKLNAAVSVKVKAKEFIDYFIETLSLPD